MKDFSPRQLSSLFSPRSIAVVGASRQPLKVGHIVVRNIISSGFRGAVFPVNPEARTIEGRSCYARYQDLPTAPDLAIVAVPAPAVIEALPAIAKKGTRQVVVLGAGFKEAGAAGSVLEQKLRDLAREFSMNILGPNCLGFVNNRLGLNATFASVPPTMGNLRFISQSGAIASAMFDWTAATELGFSDFVTIGNKAVLDENDILRYWEEAPESDWPSRDQSVKSGLSPCRPIGLYLESIGAGQEFVRLARRITRHDPIFILKPGKSSAAQAAMQSHTGALVNDDAVLDEALRTAGVIRCAGVEDLFDLARVFAWERPPLGPNIAVVSNAGGPAVITTEALALAGLARSPITKRTHKILNKHLPPAASQMNPIDILGDALADRYRVAAEAVLAEASVDALVVILTPQVMTQIAQTAAMLTELSQKYPQPIVCSFMGGSRIQEGEVILNRAKIPSFRFPERAVAALAAMWRWRQSTIKEKKAARGTVKGKRKAKGESAWKAEKIIRSAHITKLLTAATAKKQKALNSFDAGAVMRAAGILTPPTAPLETGVAGRAFGKRHGFPVVLKISSSAVVHKTEMRGVMANLMNASELTKAWRTLQQRIASLPGELAASATIVIQKHITNGLEAVVGCKRDPNFGPVMLFGAGGILAELVADRHLRLLPVTADQAREFIHESKLYPLLAGFRGQPPYAIEPVCALMVQLGSLLEQFPEISELEINPVIITRRAAYAADARVIL